MVQNHEHKNAAKIWCASYTLGLQYVTMTTMHIKTSKKIKKNPKTAYC